jgi:hypothetical protein
MKRNIFQNGKQTIGKIGTEYERERNDRKRLSQ